MDFMHDRLYNGRRFRTLNIIDDYNREVLHLEAQLSMSRAYVAQVVNNLIQEKGKPIRIRVDNGPEFILQALQEWSKQSKVQLQFIQPGKPTQNGYIERFNRSFREAVLDAYIFENITQVNILAKEWVNEYNTKGPHEVLGNLSPLQYRISNNLSNLVLSNIGRVTDTLSINKVGCVDFVKDSLFIGKRLRVNNCSG